MPDSYDAAASAAVLTNPDLLHDIFTFVPLTESYRESYLARCTTVCRAFQEPADRILWRNLHTLLPLWHLVAPPNISFPSRFHHSHGLYGRSDALMYLQKVHSAQLYLDPIQWERFQRHAAQVRIIGSLSHDWDAMTNVNRLLVQAVAIQNGGTPLLPRLCAVQWRAGATTVFGDGTLIPFFTSTLRQATLDFVRLDEAEIVPLLRRLRESSPFLGNLSIYTGPSQLDSSLSIIPELLGFTQLDQVRVPRAGFEGFQALATKANLTCLDVSEVVGPWIRFGHTISVRHLRELSVKGNASVLSGIFNFFRFEALKSAKILLECSAEMDVVLTEIITGTLVQFCDAIHTSGLQELDLMVSSRVPPSRGNEPSLRHLFFPLLPIHGLRHFRFLSSHPAARIDSADIVALASAWPKIEHLFLTDGISFDSTVSFGDIHHLYAHCKHLEEVHITRLSFPIIGVHEIPPAPLDHTLLPPHPLRCLSVRSYHIRKTSMSLVGPDISDEGAEALARYLLSLFPRLDTQRYKRELDQLNSKRWGHRSESMHFDGRWGRIVGHIYSLCHARDGL